MTSIASLVHVQFKYIHHSRSHISEPIHARSNEGKQIESVLTWRLINQMEKMFM
jgi:hypothetical protein